MGTWVKVAGVDDVKPGESKVVEAAGQPIGLFNVGGTFHAIFNTCAHRGGPLGEGMLTDAIVTCPWHGWEYDVTTGACVGRDTIKLKTYPTKVEGLDIFVEV